MSGTPQLLAAPRLHVDRKKTKVLASGLLSLQASESDEKLMKISQTTNSSAP